MARDIQELKKYRRRAFFKGELLFADMPPEQQERANGWMEKFKAKWEGNLPPWRFAILAGQARRLAKEQPGAAWGRRMLAKRGGYAVQRRYVLGGRTGLQHTAYLAAAASVRARKIKAKEEGRCTRNRQLRRRITKVLNAGRVRVRRFMLNQPKQHPLDEARNLLAKSRHLLSHPEVLQSPREESRQAETSQT